MEHRVAMTDIGRRRRRPFIGLVAAAAIAVVLLVAQALLPGGSRGANSASAASTLRDLGATAAGQPDLGGIRPGQYLYYRMSSGWSFRWYPEGSNQNGGTPLFVYQISSVSERWFGTDASGRLRDTIGEVRFPTAADEEAWAAAGSPSLFVGGQKSFPAGEFVAARDLSDLSTDPVEVLAMMRGREIVGGPAGDWESFQLFQDLLRSAYAPPEQRAAIFRAAAMLQGMRSEGEMTDHLGRTGIGITMIDPSGGETDTLIFDPASAAMLEVRRDDSHGKRWETIEATGITDSTSQTVSILQP
jgi:RNA polymerase sigma-70 factor (ECF subfamily)